MVLEDYEVKEDDFFIIFCDDKNLSINSQKKYANALKNYTTFHQLTLEQLLDEADEEEENNVRLSRRKIRSRLISFRTHLINDLCYKASTIKTNLICAKSFYRYHGIEVPHIPNAVLTESPNDSLEFDDLPTINDIRTAIESTKKAKHKALFLFAACNGSARMELTTFKFKQFLEGVAPFCNKPKTPQDIIDDLDGKCEELEVIPVFKMRRQKTNYSYYAPITPECTQFCINYLKAEGLGLKPKDSFFQLSKDGVSTAFKLINEKFNWGKRGLYGFYSSHRIRKFNASVIEDTDFANFIQGRRPDPIKETYFKKDINRVRDEYKKHMHKFTVYAHYDVVINSDAYNELLEQKNELEQQLNETKEEYEEKIAELNEDNEKLRGRIDSVELRIDDIARENDIKAIMDYASHNIVVNEHGLMDIVVALYDADYKSKRVKIVDEDYKQTLVNRALIIQNQRENDPNSPKAIEERLKMEYGEKYSELKTAVDNMKRELLRTKYGELQLTMKNQNNIDGLLIKYVQKLLSNNDSPLAEDIEEIIFNSLNIYDDITVIDAYEYVNRKEQQKAEEEELEKLQNVEKEMYGLDD